MKKVVFEEVGRCDDCPYFRHQEDNEYAYVEDMNGWFECGYTDNIIIGDKEFHELRDTDPYQFPIPDWCPLEDYGVYEIAMKSVKTVEFIERAKEVHGDKYDYSLVEYINSKSKVEIICPEHGKFLQTPLNHVYRRRGCQKCTGTKKLTKEEFIDKSVSVHGDKYDYSNVVYVNNKTKVKIICPEHGIFEQEPQSHIKGFGCPKCSGKYKYTTNEFIKIVNKIHG